MGEVKEFTFAQVAEHKTKKDILIVVHDKVYDTTKFVDEHPGGEEVLLDVGGADATEAFEDVGHSDEAREILEGMLVGTLKRMPGDPKPKVQPVYPSASSAKSDGANMGVVLYGVVFVGAVLAFGAYKYLQTRQEGQ